MNFFNEFLSNPSLFILGVALVSFILGLILGYLIWGRTARIRKVELEKTRNELEGLKKDYADLKEKFTITEADLKKTVDELDELKVRKRQLENEKGQLYADMFSVKKELETTQKNAKLATKESTFFVAEFATRLAHARGEKPKGIPKVSFDESGEKDKKAGDSKPAEKKESAMGTASPEGKEKAKESGKPDDLKVIEGIGPKIESIFKDAGIKTYAQMANTSAEKLKEILEAAGDRFRMHDPTTWPQQAKLAAEGKMDELKKLQDELQGGRK